MKYKMIVSDFDRTLGRWPEIIAPETVEAIKKYQQKGGIFVICTGRMLQSAIKIYKVNGLNGIVAAYQGAVIYNTETKERLFDDGMDYKVASVVAKDFIESGLKTVADIEDVMYLQEDSEYSELHKDFAPVVKVESLVDTINKLSKKVYKVVAVDKPEIILKNTIKFQEKYKEKTLMFNNGSDRLIEVIDKCYSKGKVVEFLANYFGIPYSEVMTVGDSTNDEELVKGEWYGVAVGNAVQSVKDVAKEVTVDFEDQPIKTLIEKYCLD